MKYTFYSIIIILLTTSHISGMKRCIQEIKVPHNIAMQCQTIKDMCGDTDTTITPTIELKNHNLIDTIDIKLLISYIKQIQYINNLQDSQSTELNKTLSWDLNTLNNHRLIKLLDNVDYLHVIDKNNHYYLINLITERMQANIHNKKKFKLFKSIEDIGPMRAIKQKIAGPEKLDSTFIQYYANTLTTTSSLPRTESIWQLSCEKICNIFRSNKICKTPCYFNPQTGTIIKSENILNRFGFAEKIKSLRIFKKNTPPVVIEILDADIKEIVLVNANENETLFICQADKTRYDDIRDYCGNYFVIDLNSKNNDPLSFHYACAFTQNDNELYVSTKQNNTSVFGILNITTNQFTNISIQPTFACFVQKIATNKDKTYVVLLTYNCILIGHDKIKSPTVFKEFNCYANLNAYEQLHYTNNEYNLYRDICLHPYTNKIYITNKSSHDPFLLIDPAGQPKLKYVIKLPRFRRIFQIISDKILFIENSCTQEDFYFNIETGNFWTKNKQGKSISLTTDGRYAIEERGLRYKVDSDIILTPTINDTIKNVINAFNNGDFPLFMLTIARSKGITRLDDNDYNRYINSNKDLKKVIDSSHIITNSSLLGFIKGIFYYMHPTVTYWTKTITCCALIIISSIALSIFKTKFDPDNKIDMKDIIELTKNIVQLTIK